MCLQAAQVFGIDVGDTQKKVYTPEGTLRVALVLASGAMGRTASISGEAEFLGRGSELLRYLRCSFHRNREVVVVGISNEAIEEAQVLTKFASTVHWVTPKDPTLMNGHAQNYWLIHRLSFWNKARIQAIQGDDSGVTSVEVLLMGQKTTQTLPVEGAFIYLQGAKPIPIFWAVELKKPDGGVKVDEMMQTNIQVYGRGDIRNTPFKQAVVAVGTVASPRWTSTDT